MWSTDGTESGTALFADLEPGKTDSRPFILASANGTLYFQTNKPGGGSHFWATDGGTPRELGVAAGLQGSNNSTFWPVGTKFYFGAQNSLNGVEPWVTDGTDAGTHMVANLAPDSAPSADPYGLAAVGNTLLFTARGDASGNLGIYTTIWRTDGTAGGTYPLMPGHVLNSGAFSFGSIALFYDQQKLLLTDGTPQGTTSADAFVKRIGNTSLSSIIQFGDDLYFGGDTLLHTTVADGPVINLGAGYPQNLLSVAGRLFFYADGPSHSRGIWTTDGTPSGTYATYPDLFSDRGSVGAMVTMDGALYFMQADKDGTKTRLMRNDGTIDGLIAVKEFAGNASNTRISASAHHLFFFTRDGMWASDGTEAGTVKLLAELPQYGGDLPMIANGDRILFDQYADFNAPHHLWSSDGTVAGTVVLHQSPQAIYPVTIDGVTYFTGHDDAHGYEPWTTDGTLTGTKLLYDVNPGSASSFATGFKKAGNTVYFSAYTDANGRELWALPLTTPQLSIADARGAEGDSGTSVMHFKVTLSQTSNQPVTVQYATSDATAHAGEDYDAASGTVTFAPGDVSKMIDVTIHGDTVLENNETFFVRLRNAGGAALPDPDAFGVIEENDQSADLGIRLELTNDNSGIFSTLDITNNGPGSASNVVWTIASTSTWGQCNPYSQICTLSMLANNATKQAYLYNEPLEQTWLSATVGASQRDPQTANNTVAWTVGAQRSIAMDAPFLTPGATATIQGITYSSTPGITSSDPTVVSLSAPTINGSFIKVTATALKTGTSTITTNGPGKLLVMVVPPGTTPRWPGGVQFSAGNTTTNFDQPFTVTATPVGLAPFTGASRHCATDDSNVAP